MLARAPRGARRARPAPLPVHAGLEEAPAADGGVRAAGAAGSGRQQRYGMMTTEKR